MAKVTFLGTTCMQPTKNRNHTGIHISYDGLNILFDCGEGIQRQMRTCKLKPSKITHIFLTHWHGDHVLGIPGILSSMGTDQVQHTVQIYGPKGTRKHFSNLKKVFPSMNAVKHKVHEIAHTGAVLDSEDFVVVSDILSHSVPCLGFAFEIKDKLRIDMKKAKKAGLSEGPILSKIQSGKNVRVKGKLVKAKDVTFIVPGKKISYVADTRPCPGARRLAKNADALIIESTFLFADKKHALKYDHMTARESAELAVRCGVKKVYLTHPSLRYKDAKVLLREAKKYHKKTVMAEDFMTFEV